MALGPLGPLIDRLRARPLALKPRAGRKTDSASEAEPPVADDALEPRAFAAAIAAIPPDAPDRRRRVFRAFLQAILARELHLRDPDAPASQELIERVLEAMEGQPDLRAAIEKATDELLRRIPRGSNP